ncbi:Ricin B-like lectin [Pleurotus pulmonarius]|nr:hypothetical protein EYR36_008133 [Pleurotus pulmonarius]
MYKRLAPILAIIPILSAMPSGHLFLDTTPTPTVPKFSTIHPDNNYSKCLDVRGGVRENGTLIQLHDCNGSKAQKWVVSPGGTMIRLRDTDFCLDVGDELFNADVRLQTCSEGQPSQAWYYSPSEQLVSLSKGRCIEYSGSYTSGSPVRLMDCLDDYLYQVWDAA